MPKWSGVNIKVQFVLMAIAKAPMAGWSRTRRRLLW